MLVELREAVTRLLATIELRIQRTDGPAEPADPVLAPAPPPPPPPLAMFARRGDGELAEAGANGGMAAAAAGGGAATAVASPWAKTPRNAPCPCGSGKKYKHCHGRI